MQIGGSGVLVQPMTYIFDEEPLRWQRLLENLGEFLAAACQVPLRSTDVFVSRACRWHASPLPYVSQHTATGRNNSLLMLLETTSAPGVGPSILQQ